RAPESRRRRSGRVAPAVSWRIRSSCPSDRRGASGRIFPRTTFPPCFPTMRVLLQRVSRAEVRVGSRVTGAIGRGFLVLVGFTHADGAEQLAWMAEKIVGL